jgi:hypothetical protein
MTEGLKERCSRGFCSWRRWMGGQCAIVVSQSSIVSYKLREERILSVTVCIERLEWLSHGIENTEKSHLGVAALSLQIFRFFEESKEKNEIPVSSSSVEQ